MQKSEVITTVRALAEYQVYDGEEGAQYVSEVLAHALEQNLIDAFDVLVSITGMWGLQMVSFTVDVDLKAKQLVNPEQVIRPLLNQILNDTDVEVRWIGHA